ncbi:MAG: hypothetical protein M4579_002462 [Chaenotheca gracillima]|nr:MAG: hypothetical protein M4579_002462 [Chaenotheca gracillima]
MNWSSLAAFLALVPASIQAIVAIFTYFRGRPTAREPLLPLPPITRKEVRRLIAQATSDEKNAAADVQDAAVREQQAWRDVDDLLIEDGDGAEQAPPLGDTDLPRGGRQKTILPLAQQDVEPSSATAPQVSLPAARRSGRKTGPPSLLGFPPVPPGRP